MLTIKDKCLLFGFQYDKAPESHWRDTQGAAVFVHNMHSVGQCKKQTKRIPKK